MISLYKCNKRCDAVDLSTKICVSSKTKNVLVKVFNMITRINEARTLIRRISWNANDWRKCISNSVTCSQNKKNAIMINVNLVVKGIVHVKENYS